MLPEASGRVDGGPDPPSSSCRDVPLSPGQNAILYGGEGLGEYFPVSTLLCTLPKESERELALAAEQQQIEEEEVGTG